MVNLTQKIKNLALQNNIPYQDCTAKLTEYFVLIAKLFEYES